MIVHILEPGIESKANCQKNGGPIDEWDIGKSIGKKIPQKSGAPKRLAKVLHVRV